MRIVIICLLVGSVSVQVHATTVVADGTVTVAGRGPEEHLLGDLGRAFEKAHPQTSVDMVWDVNVKAVSLVKSGQADIAVTSQEEGGLLARQIAWDAIALLVNFANPVRSVSKKQAAEIFSGRARYWSDVVPEAPVQRIHMVDRPKTTNAREAFEKALGIPGQIPASAKVMSTDAEAISEVSGMLFAVTFVSVTPALRAQEEGMSIRLLFVDGVEPERETVRDGRYPLRRPILLLTQEHPSPVAEAFVEFVLSRHGQEVVRRSEYFAIEQAPPGSMAKPSRDGALAVTGIPGSVHAR